MDQNTVAVMGAGQIGRGFAVQAARYEMDDVVTPHVAGATVEANAEKHRVTGESGRQVVAGKVPETALNPGAAK